MQGPPVRPVEREQTRFGHSRTVPTPPRCAARRTGAAPLALIERAALTHRAGGSALSMGVTGGGPGEPAATR
jgi:hypothetical protein